MDYSFFSYFFYFFIRFFTNNQYEKKTDTFGNTGVFSTLEQSIAPPLKGLILQTFGAGNGPDGDTYFLKTLREACARGLVIVNVTQCHKGCVEAHYATGTALTEAGVVSGHGELCFQK